VRAASLRFVRKLSGFTARPRPRRRSSARGRVLSDEAVPQQRGAGGHDGDQHPGLEGLRPDPVAHALPDRHGGPDRRQRRTGREPLYHIAVGETPEWAWRNTTLKPLEGFPGVMGEGPRRRKRTADAPFEP
jgi:hypothetical protein